MPFEMLLSPIWSSTRCSASRADLELQLVQSSELAKSLGSDLLAVLITRDSERDLLRQREDVIINLHDMGAIAGDYGLTLAIEPMMLLPNMLLQSMSDAVDLVRSVASPHVGLIYDTAHVAMMDRDLVRAFDEAYEHIVLLQLADNPGRVEPGAGNLEIAPIAAAAKKRGYSGLVDLEHGWQTQTRDGEQLGLRRLREFDAAVRMLASQ
jgi:hydroxypyruvate isomerase